LPTASPEVVYAATPFAIVTVCSAFPPSENVTLPVGTGPFPLTAAVSVNGCPKFVGLCEGVSPTFVVAACTVTVTAFEVLALSFVLPPYTAVIVCGPTASAAVAMLAMPFARLPVPICVPPSRNVTDPVGVPPLLESVAVSVTGFVAMGAVVLAVRTLLLVAWVTVSLAIPEVLAR